MSREGPEKVEQPRHRPGRLSDEEMDAQALSRDHVLAVEVHRLRAALERYENEAPDYLKHIARDALNPVD